VTDTKLSLLTITFNCMVAGIIAGILFSMILCAIVLLIVGNGDVAVSRQQVEQYRSSPASNTEVIAAAVIPRRV
jgi:hypothetical protein